MFYLTFSGPGAAEPISAVSAADALRQAAEWELRGVKVEITDHEGNVVTAQQLRELDKNAKGT